MAAGYKNVQGMIGNCRNVCDKPLGSLADAFIDRIVTLIRTGLVRSLSKGTA